MQEYYAARDKLRKNTDCNRKKEKVHFVRTFEKFAYKNLGYTDYKELGPGEIVVMTPKTIA